MEYPFRPSVIRDPINMFNGYNQPLFEPDPGRDGSLKKPGQPTPWPYGQTLYNNPENQQQSSSTTWQPKPAYPTMAGKCACAQCQQGPWYHKEPDPVPPASGTQDMMMMGSGGSTMSGSGYTMDSYPRSDSYFRSSIQPKTLQSCSYPTPNSQGYSPRVPSLPTMKQPTASEFTSFDRNSEQYMRMFDASAYGRKPPEQRPKYWEGVNSAFYPSQQYQYPSSCRYPPFNPPPYYYQGSSSAQPYQLPQQQQQQQHQQQTQNGMQPYYGIVQNTMQPIDVRQQSLPSYMKPDNNANKISPLRLMRKKKNADAMGQLSPPRASQSMESTPALDVRRFLATWADAEDDDSAPVPQMVVLDCQDINPDQAELLRMYEESTIRIVPESETAAAEPEVRPEPQQPKTVEEPEELKEPEPVQSPISAAMALPLPQCESQSSVIKSVYDNMQSNIESSVKLSQNEPCEDPHCSTTPSPASPANSNDSMPVLADLPTSEYRKNKFLDYDQQSFPQLPARPIIPESPVPCFPEPVPAQLEDVHPLEAKKGGKKRGRKPTIKFSIQKSHDLKISLRVLNENKNVVEQEMLPETKADSKELITFRLEGGADDMDLQDVRAKRARKLKRRLRLEQSYSVSSEDHLSDATTDGFQVQESVDSAKIKLTFKRRRGDIDANSEMTRHEEVPRKIRRRADRALLGNDAVGAEISDTEEPPSADTTTDYNGLPSATSPGAPQLSVHHLGGSLEMVDPLRPDDPHDDSNPVPELRPAEPLEDLRPNIREPSPHFCATTRLPNEPDSSHQSDDEHPIKTPRNSNSSSPKITSSCHITSPRTSTDSIERELQAIWNGDVKELTSVAEEKEETLEVSSNGNVVDFYTEDIATGPLLDSQPLITSQAQCNPALQLEANSTPAHPKPDADCSKSPHLYVDPTLVAENVLEKPQEDLRTTRTGVICHGLNFLDEAESDSEKPLDLRGPNNLINKPSDVNQISTSTVSKPVVSSPLFQASLPENNSILNTELVPNYPETAASRSIDHREISENTINAPQEMEQSNTNTLITHGDDENNSDLSRSLFQSENKLVTEEEDIKSQMALDMELNQSTITGGIEVVMTEEQMNSSPRAFETQPENNFESDSLESSKVKTSINLGEHVQEKFNSTDIEENRLETDDSETGLNSLNEQKVELSRKRSEIKNDPYSGHADNLRPEDNLRFNDASECGFEEFRRGPRTSDDPCKETLPDPDSQNGPSALQPTDEHLGLKVDNLEQFQLCGSFKENSEEKVPETTDFREQNACYMGQSDSGHDDSRDNSCDENETEILPVRSGSFDDQNKEQHCSGSSSSSDSSDESSSRDAVPAWLDKDILASQPVFRKGPCTPPEEPDNMSRSSFSSSYSNCFLSSEAHSLSTSEWGHSSSRAPLVPEPESSFMTEIVRSRDIPQKGPRTPEGPFPLSNLSIDCLENVPGSPEAGQKTPRRRKSCEDEEQVGDTRVGLADTDETIGIGSRVDEVVTDFLKSDKTIDESGVLEGKNLQSSHVKNMQVDPFLKSDSDDTEGPSTNDIELPDGLDSEFSNGVLKSDRVIEDAANRDGKLYKGSLKLDKGSSKSPALDSGNKKSDVSFKSEEDDQLRCAPLTAKAKRRNLDYLFADCPKPVNKSDLLKMSSSDDIMKDTVDELCCDSPIAPADSHYPVTNEHHLDEVKTLPESGEILNKDPATVFNDSVTNVFAPLKCISPMESPIPQTSDAVEEDSIEVTDTIQEVTIATDSKPQRVADGTGTFGGADEDSMVELLSDENANVIVTDTTSDLDDGVEFEREMDASEIGDSTILEHVGVDGSGLCAGTDNPTEPIKKNEYALGTEECTPNAKTDVDFLMDGELGTEQCAPYVKKDIDLLEDGEHEELEDGEIVDDEDEYIVVSEEDIIVQEGMLVEVSDDEVSPVVVMDVAVADIPLPPGEAPKENCFDLSKLKEIRSQTMYENAGSPIVESCDSPFPVEALDLFRNPSPPGTPRLLISPDRPEQRYVDIEAKHQVRDLCPAVSTEDVPDDAEFRDVMESCLANATKFLTRDSVTDSEVINAMEESENSACDQASSRDVLLATFEPPSDLEIAGEVSSADASMDLSPFQSALGPETLPVDNWPYYEEEVPLSPSWPASEDCVPLQENPPEPESQHTRIDLISHPLLPRYLCTDRSREQLRVIYGCSPEQTRGPSNILPRARRRTFDAFTGHVMPRKKFASERQRTDSDAELDIMKENAASRLKCRVSLERLSSLDERLHTKKCWWPRNSAQVKREVVKEEQKTFLVKSEMLVGLETEPIRLGDDYNNSKWQPKVVLSRICKFDSSSIKCGEGSNIEKSDGYHGRSKGQVNRTNTQAVKRRKSNDCKIFRPSNKDGEEPVSKNGSPLSENKKNSCSITHSKGCEILKLHSGDSKKSGTSKLKIQISTKESQQKLDEKTRSHGEGKINKNRHPKSPIDYSEAKIQSYRTLSEHNVSEAKSNELCCVQGNNCDKGVGQKARDTVTHTRKKSVEIKKSGMFGDKAKATEVSTVQSHWKSKSCCDIVTSPNLKAHSSLVSSLNNKSRKSESESLGSEIDNASQKVVKIYASSSEASHRTRQSETANPGSGKLEDQSRSDLTYRNKMRSLTEKAVEHYRSPIDLSVASTPEGCESPKKSRSKEKSLDICSQKSHVSVGKLNHGTGKSSSHSTENISSKSKQDSSDVSPRKNQNRKVSNLNEQCSTSKLEIENISEATQRKLSQSHKTTAELVTSVTGHASVTTGGNSRSVSQKHFGESDSRTESLSDFKAEETGGFPTQRSSGSVDSKGSAKSLDQKREKMFPADSASEWRTVADPRPEEDDEPSDHEQPWVCCVCGFNDVAQRQKHIQEHFFHCQCCHLAFKSEGHFIRHLTRRHQDIRKMHHCLLCELSFETDLSYQEHLLTREHTHLEAVEKSTICTLFSLLSGQSCPVLGPIEPRPEWLPSQAGAVHFYHQATPLSLAVRYWQMKQSAEMPKQ